MPTVQINGARINYIQMGCESGDNCEDLVMVHGLATNLAFWYLHHASAFSKQYRVTLFDLRGHGRSSITESGYTPPNMALDLQHLLDHLNIKRAHFLAHSFGGVIALNLACRAPDRIISLILTDTHISAVRGLQKTKDWKFGKKIQPILLKYDLDLDVREPYFGYKLLSAVARLQIQKVEIPQDLTDLIKPLLGKNGNRTARQWLKLMQTTQAEKELMGDDTLTLDSLRKLTFPILAIYGEHSQAMSTCDQLLNVWPHADFRRIRQAGHFFPITRPSDFMENCRQFWDGAFKPGISLREGDYNKSKRYFRNTRFYNRGDKWFIHTREAEDTGPFENLNEAQEFLESQILSGETRKYIPNES